MTNEMTEKRTTEEFVCGICGRKFEIVTTDTPIKSRGSDGEERPGIMRTIRPRKIEMIPSSWPNCKFICKPCQESNLLLIQPDRDALWEYAYPFTTLEKFYEDFPGEEWSRWLTRSCGKLECRIMKKGSPYTEFYTTDTRLMNAIKEMPEYNGSMARYNRFWLEL